MILCFTYFIFLPKEGWKPSPGIETNSTFGFRVGVTAGLPAKHQTDCGHDDLFVVEIDVGIAFVVTTFDVKTYRFTAPQVPVPGIFVVSRQANTVKVVFLFLVENRIGLVIVGPTDRAVDEDGEEIPQVGVSKLKSILIIGPRIAVAIVDEKFERRHQVVVSFKFGSDFFNWIGFALGFPMFSLKTIKK